MQVAVYDSTQQLKNLDSVSYQTYLRYASYSLRYTDPEGWSRVSLMPFPDALDALARMLDQETSGTTLFGVGLKGELLLVIMPLLALALSITLLQHLLELERCFDKHELLDSHHAFPPLYDGWLGLASGAVSLILVPATVAVAFGAWVTSRAAWAGYSWTLIAIVWVGIASAVLVSVAVLLSTLRLRSVRAKQKHVEGSRGYTPE